MTVKPRGTVRKSSRSRPTESAPAGNARRSPVQNHLLRALQGADFARIEPHLELDTDAPRRRPLRVRASGCATSISPRPRIVSLLYVMEDGASAEIAVVGNEGILGISLFMGGETTPSRAVVQSAGHGYRLRAAVAQGRIRPVRADDAPAAALHAGADHADGADRGLQPPPFARPAAVPLAAAEPRPPVSRTNSP